MTAARHAAEDAETVEVEPVDASDPIPRVDATSDRAAHAGGRPAPTGAAPGARADGPTATLDAELSGRVEAKAHRYWTNLLKGEAAFRGVPMAGVRASVRRVWTAHDLAAWSIDDLLARPRPTGASATAHALALPTSAVVACLERT